MNKNDLIREAAQIVLSNHEARAVVEHLIEEIKKSLVRDEPVRIAGLGTFRTVQTKARTGRNPRTGEAILIPAKRIAKFTPAKALREALE